MAIAHKTSFSIDGFENETFEGYTFGATWNGWACPYFTLPVAEKIMRLLNTSEPCDGQDSLEYNGRFFTMVTDDNPEPYREEIPRQKINTIDGTRVVYAIGSFGWCWWDESWGQ